MSDWDYEDDVISQEIVYRGCAKIRNANQLLNEVHQEMTDSLHETGKRIILSELQVTDEITNDMRNTYFGHHHEKKLERMMPRSDFVENVMKARKGEV
jgi:hypothetical protein